MIRDDDWLEVNDNPTIEEKPIKKGKEATPKSEKTEKVIVDKEVADEKKDK